MKIAIASGKGGTGKTTLAVNLAYFNNVDLFDLDVEEPNDYLFFKCGKRDQKYIYRKIPVVDTNACYFCGKCQEVCHFNAILVLEERVSIFHELCHSCGACVYFCPAHAIEEIEKPIGKVITLVSDINLTFGQLEIGERSPVPLIRVVKERINGDAILDVPPGISCPLVESIRDTDYIILVAEPTPFSLHDLKLTIDVINNFDINFGVVINKFRAPFRIIDEFCEKRDIPILGRLPFSFKIAEKYSRGELLFEYEDLFKDIYEKVMSYG